jgi:protein-L-isoaspartate(D-aspartate) O-methyltransferase
MRRTIHWKAWIVAVLLVGCGIGPAPPEDPLMATEVPPTAVTDLTLVPTEDPRLAAEREEMVVRQIERRGVSDPQVLEAMRSVQRHLFVPPDYRAQSYQDHPLPIGFGQTISQPYIVAWMTELLELEPDHKVLEIGTGSGYQAAVLAVIVDAVYTIEIIPELADSARDRLKSLDYDNIEVLRADGYWGWTEHAPYDAIIVTAAPDHLPQPLVQQLKPGGRLVVPIGPSGGYQSLWQFTLEEDGLVGTEIAGVRFVPFVRGE